MKKKARVTQQRAAVHPGSAGVSPASCSGFDSRRQDAGAPRVGALLARRYAVGFALALGAGFAAAAEADPTSFEGPEDAGKNWIEFGAGGFFTSGNQSQAEQNHRHANGGFGGISDLHFEKEIAKATTFSLDGRGIVDEHDYSFGLKLKKEETYFLKLNFENFRTWSNGDGGYYPAANRDYPLAGDALALDRGIFSLEGGLTLKNWPGLRFKYSHLYRDGEKGSTIWGQSHPVLNTTAGVVPTIQDIDESRHIFEVDLTHRIKTVDFGVGAVYEFGDLKNQRRISQFPGETAAAGERKITNREGTDYDLFNAHAFAETWLKKNLFFSAGYMFSDLQNDTTGSRVWGDDFGVVFVPNPANGQGYTNLLSTARKQDHVANANLMAKLGQHWTLTPSVRIQRQDWDANSAADSTFGVNSFGSTFSAADADAIDVRERLDLRYTGLTNFVFSAQGEWTEGQGNTTENGGIFNPGTIPGTPTQRETEETRWFQKYGLNVKWYASRRISFDVGGYYKLHSYDYDHTVDSTANNAVANRYPAYLTLQDLATQDGNARVTWRPRSNLTLVGRYEYQLSTINTTPDPISGLGDAESARMLSHIVSLNASWAPIARLYLQAGVNYVDSGLRTPASDYTAAVLEAQNNYWSVNLNTGIVLDDKTDLNLGYTYYLADNYTDNTPVGVPYGSGAEEHAVSAMLLRRITKNIRASLRYSYYYYTDDSAGGFRDYTAHGVYTGLQYRF